MSDELTALRCPACGEQIVSRRLGICPSCRTKLPADMELHGAAREMIEREHQDALNKLRDVRKEGGDSGAAIL
jgi:hypothetical protein